MAYITQEEYTAVFPDDSFETSEFDVLSDVASNIVDRVTFSKIDTFGIANLTQTLQDKIKQATIYQVKAMFENGSVDVLYGQSDLNAGSVSIGKYSETVSGQGNFKGSKMLLIDGIPISPLINIKLRQTGLLDPTTKFFRLEDLNERNP